MQKWYTGQYLTNTHTGKEYVVTEVCMVVEANSPIKEEYTLMDICNGYTGKIWGNTFHCYVKSNGTNGQILKTDSGGVPVWVDANNINGQGSWPNNTIPSLNDNPSFDAFDDINIDPNDFDIFVTHGKPPTCIHEWVTWTGLHGTQTDCTKCRAIKT